MENKYNNINFEQGYTDAYRLYFSTSDEPIIYQVYRLKELRETILSVLEDTSIDSDMRMSAFLKLQRINGLIAFYKRYNKEGLEYGHL